MIIVHIGSQNTNVHNQVNDIMEPINRYKSDEIRMLEVIRKITPEQCYHDQHLKHLWYQNCVCSVNNILVAKHFTLLPLSM